MKIPRLDEGALVPTGEPRTDDPKRTSNLQSPIMLLTGHEGEIYAARFSQDGNMLVSAGFDMKICKFNKLINKIKIY